MRVRVRVLVLVLVRVRVLVGEGGPAKKFESEAGVRVHVVQSARHAVAEKADLLTWKKLVRQMLRKRSHFAAAAAVEVPAKEGNRAQEA